VQRDLPMAPRQVWSHGGVVVEKSRCSSRVARPLRASLACRGSISRKKEEVQPFGCNDCGEGLGIIACLVSKG
jgi:hypothetical protein